MSGLDRWIASSRSSLPGIPSGPQDLDGSMALSALNVSTSLMDIDVIEESANLRVSLSLWEVVGFCVVKTEVKSSASWKQSQI